LPRYHDLIAALSQPQLPLDQLAIRREYEMSHATLEKLRDQANAEYTTLLRRVGKLENQIKVMAFFSSSTARTMEPLVAKLKAAFEPIESQRKHLAATIEPRLKILPIHLA
jgi:hypothetical protein